MKYSDTEGVSFAEPSLCAGGIRLHVLRDAALRIGRRVFVEARYPACHLNIPSPSSWLREQKRRNIWQRLLCRWHLEQASVAFPPPPSDWTGDHIRELAIHSAVVPPLLLDIVVRRGAQADQRRQIAHEFLGSWLRLAVQGLAHASSDLKITVQSNSEQCTLTVCRSGRLDGAQDLFGLRPELEEEWQRLRGGTQGCFCDPGSPLAAVDYDTQGCWYGKLAEFSC